MGQRQSSLVKCTLTDENDRIKYATSSMQGLCPCTEDARATILDLDGIRSTSFFGAYDGHGGANVALYCANRFHTELLKKEQYQNNLDNSVGEVFSRMDEPLREDDEWRALANPRFTEFDLLCCLMDAASGVKGAPNSEGSTACVALIRGNQIIVGNVGDSRCVLSRNRQAMNLSTDHKPNGKEELQRIQHAAWDLTRDVQPFRCSRSIGDFSLKDNPLLRATQQVVICNSDVVIAVKTDDTEFLLIASHGMWKATPTMGQGHSYLKKFTVKDENDRINYAASSMQGLCSYMEDARQTIIDLDGTGSTSFFGVYDGHEGANVALYCANRFHTELLKDGDYQNNLDTAVGHLFFRMDEPLQEDDEWRALANPRFRCILLCCLRDATGGDQGIPYTEGSTACVALIRGNHIIVGSVGDSRCVLSRNRWAMDLSTDHKPNLQDERWRIKNAGGRLTRDKQIFRCVGQTRVQWGSYRVNGLLAMSRSIGDFYLKLEGLPATEQMVTCNPDVRTADITDDTEFLLIASDGIWDIFSSQGAVDFVHQKLASPWEVMECDSEGAGACVLGGPMDIFLVQPRKGGVPPSLFQTIRRAGWGYWTKELKFAMKLGTREDIPRIWTWESVMGRPAYGPEGCVMKAIASCTRGRHCIAFERLYGAGSFRYQLSDVHMRYLIKACVEAGACDSVSKSASVLEVLLLMKKRGIWIRTQLVEGGEICLLPFNRFGLLNLKKSTCPADTVAAIIREEGPIIGSLSTGPAYLLGDDDEEYVYREKTGDPPNHAVVCIGYRYQDGEVHMRVLDNVARDGPLRWILYQVFHSFYVILVNALDRAALQQQTTTGLQYVLQ